ncbi:MAG: methyl-accepting chemotaxis protein [Armatimonadetes bacterium]|nr:methyl-accepting chemotaxis protein [Armatimonadota bacterium]
MEAGPVQKIRKDGSSLQAAEAVVGMEGDSPEGGNRLGQGKVRLEAVETRGKGTPEDFRGLLRVLSTIASKDLTVEPSNAIPGGKDAHAIVGFVRQLVGTIKENSSRLGGTCAILIGAVSDTASSSEAISKALQDLSDAAAEQSDIVETTTLCLNTMMQKVQEVFDSSKDEKAGILQTVHSIEQMNQAIEQVASELSSLSAVSSLTARAAQNGEESVNKTIDGMERIKVKVFESAAKIKLLGQQSEQIGEIVEVIDEIADQTNLLALNAAIEAARAGEHGRGFAVVADEVRKLAERSRKSTQEIGKLITGIQRGTAEAVKAMEEGSREAESGSEIAQAAGKALTEILTAVEQTDEQIQNISAVTQEMSASSSELAKVADNVTQHVEGNVKNIERFYTATQELDGFVNTLRELFNQNADSLKDLSGQAGQLPAMVEKITTTTQFLSHLGADLKQIAISYKVP